MLVRFIPADTDTFRPGLIRDGQVHDLSARYPSVRAFLESHPTGWDSARVIDEAAAAAHDIDAVRLGPPIDESASIYLVGANYRSYLAHAGMGAPAMPLIFTKPAAALIGPREPIHLLPLSTKMDYEAEMAVIIGRQAHNVSQEAAPGHIAGLTIVNDTTARDLQWIQVGEHRLVDWFSTKAMDHATPIGPGIVSVSSVDDIHRLRLTTDLNGERMQDGETSDMIFSVWALIEFLSARVTLRPGDVISTGTPAGVGEHHGRYLVPGDSVRIEIGGVGVLENPVITP